MKNINDASSISSLTDADKFLSLINENKKLRKLCVDHVACTKFANEQIVRLHTKIDELETELETYKKDN